MLDDYLEGEVKHDNISSKKLTSAYWGLPDSRQLSLLFPPQSEAQLSSAQPCKDVFSAETQLPGLAWLNTVAPPLDNLTF